MIAAQDNPQSISQLMRKTLDGLDNERVRALFVSAQICDVDFKINQALVATFKWFNAWQTKQDEYLGWRAPFKYIASWFTSDVDQNIGKQLCCIVFETFGYTTTHADTASSVIWNNFKDTKIEFTRSLAFISGTTITTLLASEAALLALPLSLVFMLSIRAIPGLVKNKAFKQMLLIALIDELLIADHIFWINPKSLTANGFRTGYDQYQLIATNVHREAEEMLANLGQDKIFDFKTVEEPIHEIIKKNRYRPGRRLKKAIH
jgi:hypothetical protein